MHYVSRLVKKYLEYVGVVVDVRKYLEYIRFLVDVRKYLEYVGVLVDLKVCSSVVPSRVQ